MSFFQELKRRNVFRVGIAYAVAGWLLLQFTEVLSELLQLPPEIGPIVVTFVAIGLPVALLLAWAYELTPEGLKRESEISADQSITAHTGKKLNGLIMGMLVLAVAYLLVDKFLLRTPKPEPLDTVIAVPLEVNEHSSEPADELPQIDPHSIAVLPFTNRSPVADDEFFIDGIHDDLLTNLARVGDLKVISRTSVGRYRDTEKSIPEIAAELGVATIMEGAVQRAGDMVRINVQLIDANTDEHLWAEIFDRELSTQNLFAIQSEIAEKIAESLQAQLTPEESRQLQSQPTENLAAYSAYLRGMRDFERREIESMQNALAEFRRAVELDPEFAQAWAGIAFVATVMPSWGAMSKEDGFAIAEPAALRALSINPELGESQLAMGVMLEADDEASAAYFERAIKLMPGYAPAFQWYGNLLQDMPNQEERALQMFRRAAELDPLSPLMRHQVARHLLFMGRFEEAQATLEALVETDPDFFPGVSFMSVVLAPQGQFDEAVRWDRRSAQLDPDSFFPLLGQIFSMLDLQDEEGLVAMREVIAQQPDRVRPILEAFLETGIAAVNHRWSGAIENIQGAPPAPFFDPAKEMLGWMHTLNRDYPRARQAMEQHQAQFFDPETRSLAIEEQTENACNIGYVLVKTGDPELGRALVEDTIAFANSTLAEESIHFPWGGNLHHCYAITGDWDKSLEIMQTLFDHGHHISWWERNFLEYYDPLRGDPRFESLMQQISDEMARQRQSLRDEPELAGP